MGGRMESTRAGLEPNVSISREPYDASLELSIPTDKMFKAAHQESLETKNDADGPHYTPYEASTLSTPLLDFMLFPTIKTSLQKLIHIRWVLARPLNLYFLPKWIPYLPVPFLKWIPYVTVGEVLFTLPLLAMFAASYSATFISPSVSGSGNVAGYPIYATFLTANKANSLFSFLMGIPFERMIKWHMLCAILAAVAGSFHLYVAFSRPDSGDSSDSHDRDLLQTDDGLFTNDGNVHRGLSGDSQFSLEGQDPDFLRFLFDGDTNTSGSILLLALLCLTGPSLFPILRRWFFELFYYSHIILAICVVIFSIAHSVTGIIGVLVWCCIDLTTRYCIMAGYKYPHQASLRLLAADILEISFPKTTSFDYKAGQYIMLAVPKISLFQFHPYTISSSPDQDVVTMHIRILGDWTRRLYKLAKEGDVVSVLIEGPYGNLSVNLEDDNRYKMALLISGGIGVTPMLSICNGLVHDHLMKRRKMKHISFVWSVREYSMLEAMIDDTVASVPDSFLHKEIYLTRKPSVNEQVKGSLASNVHMGRPDIDKIFQEMKQAASVEGESRVAVCVCGPAQLIDACKEASRKYSDSGCRVGGGSPVQFDCHEETFDF